MGYVIIDPGMDYAGHMMEFLGRYGLKAVAVFSSPAEFHSWNLFSKQRMGHLVLDEFLATQFPSVEALAAQIRRDVPGELHGIIPWAELTILFGAELSDALGLEWNSAQVIRRFRNKFAMKEALRAAGGVRINASQVVHTVEEAEAFVHALGSWPVVVKPAEGAGSRGVFFVHSLDELVEAGRQVFAQGAGEILLEEYVGGREYVVNGVTDHTGRMLVTDVWAYDKRDVGPHRNLYFQTIKVSSYDPVWYPLAVYATQAIHGLGLRKAPVHMELKVDAQGPCMIEVGARFAGGNQPLLASELHGRSLFELAACHYLSDSHIGWEDVHYDRYDARHARIVSGVQTEFLPYVSEVVGADVVQHLPSFYGFGKLMPVGASVPVTTDLMGKSYEVYLFHANPEQLEADEALIRQVLRYR